MGNYVSGVRKHWMKWWKIYFSVDLNYTSITSIWIKREMFSLKLLLVSKFDEIWELVFFLGKLWFIFLRVFSFLKYLQLMLFSKELNFLELRIGEIYIKIQIKKLSQKFSNLPITQVFSEIFKNVSFLICCNWILVF